MPKSKKVFSKEEEKEIERIAQNMLNGSTLSSERGLDSNQLEAIYSIGHNLYSHGKYSEAEKIFSFLCLYNHLDKRFWKGLAATRQLQKQYLDAANTYAIAAVADVEDPEPAFYAASCLLSISDTDRARKALQAVIHLSSDKKEFLSLKQQSQEMLNNLQQK